VWLDVAKLDRIQQAHALHAVGLPPFVEGFEAGDLRLVRRDDELPTALVRDRVLVAEPLQRRLAFVRQPRFERAGCV
jgi:hypothetical protein